MICRDEFGRTINGTIPEMANYFVEYKLGEMRNWIDGHVKQ